MAKTMKRSVSMMFVIIMLSSMLAVPSQALNDNQVEMDVSYLSKEKCWIEAGKYVEVTGLSQPRIASELYAHALADNIGYKAQNIDKRISDLLGDYLVGHAHVVEIGADDSVREAIYSAAWRMVDIDGYDAYFHIRSKLDWNKVIDVNGNSDSNGAKIQLYDDNGTRAQTFAFYMNSDGWYTIFKKDTFQCLDVSGGVADKEVNIQLYEYNGTAAQKWKLYKAGDGYVYLKNQLGYYMDACGGSSDNGTQIWTYTLNYTNAQKWRTSLA